MDSKSAPKHAIDEHDGILNIRPDPSGKRVHIDFDPNKLSEQDIREIASEHIRPVLKPREDGLQHWVLRLDGRACEAAALKLQNRVSDIHGVRSATATYIGKVLCLTFDSNASNKESLWQSLQQAGAKISPLKATNADQNSWLQKLRAGELNDEISFSVGFFCLVSAIICQRFQLDTIVSFLYGGTYLFCGQSGVRAAWASLKEKTLDVDLLMVLAALGALSIGAPFEGALLLFLFNLSNLLQQHAMERTQRAIESLLKLRPDQALLKTPNGTQSVSIESLKPGDQIIVRPGELLPVDGTIAEGSSQIDESSLTGESMPVEKTTGQTVFAGTLNQSGGIEVLVSKKSDDSSLAKMVKLVAAAQAEKSQTQRFLEKAEQRYAAAVIAATALIWLIPWLVLDQTFATAFYRAMTVMVVASPCALIISTPATVLSAIGGAAKRGILIKGGSHLETAAKIDTVCFDKTGTLTHGKPKLTHILSHSSQTDLSTHSPSDEHAHFLNICSAIEARSEHPLAHAITTAVQSLKLNSFTASAFQSITGKGAEADVDGKRFIVGSTRLLQELNASGMPSLESLASPLEQTGKTCIWLAQRTEADTVIALAVFALADTLRAEAKSVVAQLKMLGMQRIVMLTGDRHDVAKAIADQVGISSFHASLLPADKVLEIRRLKESGTVLMIGDGINDAPALATSNLGVAMGAAGTDIAMETADVVIMGDRLDSIPELIGMARHARRVLTQNLVFASAVILILVTAALGFALPLPFGVIGHEGSTVLVCLNGLRLLAYRFKPIQPITLSL